MKKIYVRPVSELTRLMVENQFCDNSHSNDGDQSQFGSEKGGNQNEGQPNPSNIDDDYGEVDAQSKEFDLWDTSAFSVWN